MNGLAVVELEQKALTLADQARALKVTDQKTYDLAAQQLLGIAELRRKIEQHHAPLKKSAYAAWQAVIAVEKKLLDPVVQAEHIYKDKLGEYTAGQQRLAEEQRATAEAEALRAAEEQRERELEEAERQGADAEEITAMIAEPLVVAPARVEPAFQHAKGVSVAANWKGEVTSLEALVKGIAGGKANLNLVMANEPAINQLARATRGTLAVPGIKFFSQSTVRAGRR